MYYNPCGVKNRILLHLALHKPQLPQMFRFPHVSSYVVFERSHETRIDKMISSLYGHTLEQNFGDAQGKLALRAYTKTIPPKKTTIDCD